MIGHTREDLEAIATQIGATSIDDVLHFLSGKQTQQGLIAATGKGLNAATLGKASKAVGRFAGSKPVRMALRAVPGLSVAGAALGAADIVAGDESLGNKVMDGSAMMLGTAAGGLIGGPIGAAIGANAGKMLSDGTQWLFGDKKTPEQRKMELALSQLQGGGVI